MFDFSYILGGLHVFVALFFAVHAVRRGRELYWLLILFMFPMLGSVVYFFAIYLPESRLERKVGKVASVAMQTLDPGKALRDPAAVLFGKGLGFPETAARRHGEHDFACCSVQQSHTGLALQLFNAVADG